MEVMQSSEPESPEAATIVCPWAAACWNRLPSALAAAVPLSGSHEPQEVEITWARFWLMIALNVSNGPEPAVPELEFGPS